MVVRRGKVSWYQGWKALCEVLSVVGNDTRPEQSEVREGMIRVSSGLQEAGARVFGCVL